MRWISGRGVDGLVGVRVDGRGEHELVIPFVSFPTGHQGVDVLRGARGGVAARVADAGPVADDGVGVPGQAEGRALYAPCPMTSDTGCPRQVSTAVNPRERSSTSMS